MKWIFLNLLIAIAILSLSACSQDDVVDTAAVQALPSELTKQEMKTEFAKALSAVVNESQEARELIKSEAQKQFDKNYDILWNEIKDQPIGSCTFHESIAKKSSVEFISQIEKAIPLLNILFPNIEMFGISPELYNSNDSELPVVVATPGKNLMFYAGELTDSISKGQIPDFNVLVVNENERVIINNDVKTRASKGGYTFISPAFDGTQKNGATRSTNASSSLVGSKAISAFNYFYKDDSSVNSMALQRDYIYYGITPQSKSGSLNYSTSEYISFIEVNPTTYFTIADQTNTGSMSDDPYIKKNSVSRKKQDYTQSELIDELWTKGSYNFRVEVQRSTNEYPQIIYIPVKPSDIWNFNLSRSYRHSTGFRHSKYTYSIDPNKFTAKRYELTPYQLSLSKWNLSEESVYRYITFIEEDESQEIDFSYEYEVVKVKSSKFNGDVKLEIGLGKSDKISGGASTEVSGSNTTKENRKVTIRRKVGSDPLGSVRIYFYDPIIENKISTSEYQMRTYDTGHIKFGISAY